MLCLNCKKTFPDRWNERKAQNVLEFGQFLDNQRAIIFGEKPKHKKHYKKRVFEHRCPHCNSNRNINATALLEKLKIETKFGRIMKYSEIMNLPQYSHYKSMLQDIITDGKCLNTKKDNI